MSVRGLIGVLLSLIGVFFFSVCMLASESLIFFWFFLELVGLSSIPAFFFLYGGVSFYTLFIYLVVSSLSSSFILLGVINVDLVFFFVFGLLIKFGIFPFFGWVYSVVLGSNGVVVWLLSTLMKVPFLFICFLFCGYIGSGYSVVALFGMVTLLVLSLLFWVFNYNWRCCWGHMMVSSSVILVLVSFVLSVDVLVWLFLAYMVWATGVVFFIFFLLGDGDLIGSFSAIGFNFSLFFFFVFFLLTTPVSFSLLYKVIMSFCIFSCSLVLLLCWVVYSLSEQFFLLKFLVSSYIKKGLFSWLSLV